MEKLLLIISLLAVLLFTSCSDPVAYFSVWKGNNAYARGDYQTANTSYLKSLKKSSYAHYINYDLGNVYYALGESSSAADEWKKSILTKDEQLLFRTLYNRGILEFETGSYQDAFNSFRTALEIDPDSRNAKINLEYSLRRMNAGTASVEGTASGAEISKKKDVPDEVVRVLEFIKQKETGLWKPNTEDKIDAEERDW